VCSSSWQLSKKNAIKRLKCGSIPSKANPEIQRIFFEEKLQPLMEKAQVNEEVLLFVDASHFVMGCDFLGYAYGKVRHFVRTHSGRKRYNVLAALNFATKKLTTVTNDTYITATQVCELLRKLAVEYTGTIINLVLDNASYQKCQAVKDLATKLRINLIFLPSHSPNLNLIERAWKFVKVKLRTQYYSDFNLFIEKIDSVINASDKEYKQDFDRLISNKVQLYDNFSTVAENSCACIPLPSSLAA
jgi:transposase